MIPNPHDSISRRNVLKQLGLGTGVLVLGVDVAVAHRDPTGRGDLERSLAAVRSATARYHDLSAAVPDGYEPVSPFICGQGVHHEDRALMARIIDGDETLNPTQPPLLTYGQSEGGDDSRFRGLHDPGRVAREPDCPTSPIRGRAYPPLIV